MKKLLPFLIAFIFSISVNAQTSSAYLHTIACSQPSAVPTTTQSTCTNTANAFDLGLTFTPATPVPNYTITWSPIPNGVFSATQTAASGGIASGLYSATITATGGCSTTTSFSINPQPAQVVFNFVPNSMNFVVTCAQPTVTINLNPATYNYTWTNGVSTPQNGSIGSFNSLNLGNWTVTASNPSGCTSTQTFIVTQNITAPTSTVTPLSQNITCAGGPATFTGVTTNSLTNITHSYLSPYSTGAAFSGGTISIYNTSGPGTYTYCLTNNINGCSTCKTITVTSTNGFPTYSITSPQQFTIGCGTTSLTTINISNVTTMPVPGGPVSYTVLPPTFFGSYSLGASATYSANNPGQYTVVVHDITNNCETKIPISVIQNTLAPTLSISVLTKTLSCDIPTVTVQAITSNSNVNYFWSYPGPSNSNGSSVIINTIPSGTVIGNYSLTVTSTSNSCTSSTVTTFYQNIFAPTASITSGLGFLTCNTPSINLTSSSISNVPATFFPTLPVIGSAWYGPVPQTSLSNSTTYIAYTPGTYTLIAKDLNNGCTAMATKTVGNNVFYPQVSSPAPFNINCPAPTASIFPIVTGTTTGFTYSWTVPPTATISSFTSSMTVVNLAGTYTIYVTNPVNGCTSSTLVTVAVCAGIEQNSLSNSNINIFPNPTNGTFNVDIMGMDGSTIIEVYSGLGVLVKKQALTVENSVIDLKNEANGIYLIYVKEGEKTIKVSKIVKN
ncbi:MAG: T9SS type A sorting domain-containing protein [Bacteroidetes bacterium]|nr:T9SS type A sorting domain-containing protein [Bacteroidota bacterium]